MTRQLGGRSVPHSAREMSVGWRHYRYLASNRSLLGRLREWKRMCRRGRFMKFQKPGRQHRAEIAQRRRHWRDFRERNGLRSTAHVGLALRGSDGVLHFMHASSPSNSGKVIVDDELSKYLYRYGPTAESSSRGRCVKIRRTFAIRRATFVVVPRPPQHPHRELRVLP
jgi:hypothetical protein